MSPSRMKSPHQNTQRSAAITTQSKNESCLCHLEDDQGFKCPCIPAIRVSCIPAPPARSAALGDALNSGISQCVQQSAGA